MLNIIEFDRSNKYQCHLVYLKPKWIILKEREIQTIMIKGTKEIKINISIVNVVTIRRNRVEVEVEVEAKVEIECVCVLKNEGRKIEEGMLYSEKRSRKRMRKRERVVWINKKLTLSAFHFLLLPQLFVPCLRRCCYYITQHNDFYSFFLLSPFFPYLPSFMYLINIYSFFLSAS